MSKENIYHYTYKISFQSGHFYFGVRSCKCLPEEDTYLGSPQTYKYYWEENICCKTILRTFDTRLEANEYEEVLIDWAWETSREFSLNACNKGTKFCVFGVKRPEIGERQAKNYYLLSPEGLIFEGTDITAFCKSAGLEPSQVIKVLLGQNLHARGWTASLAAHNLYLEYYKNRGITWHKTAKSWFVVWQENGPNREGFKSIEDALKFRDNLETKGYKFRVHSWGWKNKLKYKS